jgi:tetratricopeptide (TPR) repeat protein
MRAILIGLALALVAPAALAQTQQQRDWCFSPTATDDQTIEGCTALVQSPQQSPTVKAAAYDARGFAYINKGLYDRAIADETDALALNPNSSSAYNNRGIAYDNKGLYDQAIADDTRAIALKSDAASAYNGNADSYINRGIAYERRGLRDQAIADYRAALKINPNLQKAKDGLTRLGVAP